MTDLLSDVETPSDAELISRVRGGDVAAYGELFSRHKDAAHRLARQLVRGPDSDDLVSEAFAKVLSVLQGGGGPDVAFRAYLLTAVRRLHVDRIRSGQRLQTTDDLTPFDPGVPFQDTAVAGFESGAAAKAFASLPERWQLVLWHLEVEGQKPADIAPLLGMSANSVSALAYRAREGLRQAFLTMHISDLTETDCRWVNEHLGAFIRKGLSKRDTGKVQEHLDGCRRCTAMYLELTEVNSNLAGIIAPLLLGAAATGYLASSGAGAAGVLGLLSKVKEFVGANTGAVTAAGVAVGVATAATVAALALGGGGGTPKHQVVADPPASLTTPAAPVPTLPTSKPAPTAPTASTSAAATASASPSAAVPSTTPASPAALAPEGASPSGDASPGDGPTDGGPGVSPSAVDISGTTIDDDGVHLRALGSPSLPPTLTVLLSSAPDGVTFGPGGDCDVAGDGLSATCSTGSGASGARMPGTAKAAATTSYAADLPFVFPDGQQDTDLSISVDVPAGFEVSGGSGSISSYLSRTADVSMTLDDQVAFSDDGYPVTAHLSGIPAGYTGSVTIRLADGAATITGSTTPGCAVDAGTLVCTDPADGVVGVTMAAADSGAPTSVTLRASALSGYRDPTGANNTGTTTLRARPDDSTHDADLSFSGVADQVKSSAGTYSFSGAVTGVPPGYTGQLRFSITAGDATFEASEGCALVAASATLACDARDGFVAFTLSVPDTGVDTPVTLALAALDGYTDLNDSDNSQGTLLLADLPPAAPDADLSLTLTPSATTEGDGSYVVPGTLAGVPEAYTGSVRYSVTSGDAVLVPAGGCTVESSTLVCDAATNGPVSLRLSADSSVDTDVVVAVLPLAGHTDDNQTNNTAPVTLRKDADLALALGSPVAADPDGGYTVTGTLTGVPDGYTGQVTFTLSGDPATFSADGCTPIGQTLVCDVPADGTVAFDVDAGDNSVSTAVTVTVGPLTGYTDVDETDNQARVTLQAVPVPTYDVRLTDLSPVTATADSQGAQQFTADLDRASFPGTVSFELTDGPTGAVLTQPTNPAAGSVTFTVTSSSLTGHAVGVRAVLSDPGSDPAPGNNTATSTWSPREYDVSLTGLAAAPGTADPAGDQTFTATLGRDGFSGTVGYSLTGPSDLSLTGSSVSGSTVTFTVHSTKTDLGTAAVTLSADLPTGYTDPAPGNNADGATYTYFVTPPFAYDGAATAHATTTVNEYDVTAAVKNIPAGATTLVLSVPDSQERVDSATGPCVVTDVHTVTCALPSGATSFTAHFNAQLPGKDERDPNRNRNPLTATAGSASVTTQITFP